MKTTPLTIGGNIYDLAFRKRNYAVDDSLAIEALIDEGEGFEPFASITVCLNIEMPHETWAFVDGNNLRGIEDALEAAGLAKRTGFGARRGFWTYKAMAFTKKLFEIVA